MGFQYFIEISKSQLAKFDRELAKSTSVVSYSLVYALMKRYLV